MADSRELLQFQEQVEDAGLHGDVEGAGRLVGDDQFGQRQCAAIARAAACRES